MPEARKNSTAAQSDLDFDLPPKRAPREFSLAALGMELVRFIPLMALLALLAQVGIRGMRPAMAEQKELQRKEALLNAQYAAAVEQEHQLELRLEAQDDPIYIERMRRLRLKERFAEVDSQ